MNDVADVAKTDELVAAVVTYRICEFMFTRPVLDTRSYFTQQGVNVAASRLQILFLTPPKVPDVAVSQRRPNILIHPREDDPKRFRSRR